MFELSLQDMSVSSLEQAAAFYAENGFVAVTDTDVDLLPILEGVLDQELACAGLNLPDILDGTTPLYAFSQEQRKALSQIDTSVVAPSGFAWDDSYSGGLTASFDTDIFGQLRARARSAALTAEATRLNFLATEQQLVAVMTQSWVNAATLQRRLDLANEIADSYRVTYTLTDERYDTGSRNTSASDVQIARQNLEAALADIPDLETQLAAQLIQIDLLLGRTPGQTAQSFHAELALDREMVVPAGFPADLLAQRPDVAAAALSYEAALEDIGAAKADLFPGLTLTSALSFQGDEPGDVIDFDELIASLAGSLTQPLFQGGRLRQEVRVQESEASALSSAYARTALTALSEVETALVQQAGLSVNWSSWMQSYAQRRSPTGSPRTAIARA